MKLFSIVLFSFFILSSIVNADSADDFKKQQNLLIDLNTDIEKSEKSLKKLKQNENNVQKKLANSKQKINADKKVIRGLNKELNHILSQIDDAQSELENRTQALELSKLRYLGNIRQFYLTAHKTDGEIFSEDPNEEMRLSRQIMYLSSLAGFESENVELAKNILTESVETKDDLISVSYSDLMLEK